MGRVDISRWRREEKKREERERGSKEETARSGEESCGVLTGSCNNEFISRARTLSGVASVPLFFLASPAPLLRILINEERS